MASATLVWTDEAGESAQSHGTSCCTLDVGRGRRSECSAGVEGLLRPRRGRGKAGEATEEERWRREDCCDLDVSEGDRGKAKQGPALVGEADAVMGAPAASSRLCADGEGRGGGVEFKW